MSLPQALADVERDLIRDALQEASGNRSEAAKMLGIPRRQLYRRMAALFHRGGAGDDGEAVRVDGRESEGAGQVNSEHMIMRCREELTRLDAAAQRASAEHGRASDAFLAAPLGSKERAAREREVDECRYRDGCARHAFEAARQLADVLGLIGVGEREFYVEKAK